MVVHIVFLALLFFTYYVSGGVKSEQSQETRKRQVTYMGMLLFWFAALRSPTVGGDLLGSESGESGYWFDYTLDAGLSFRDVIVYRAGRDPFFHCFLKFLSTVSYSPQTMLVVVGGIFSFGFSYFVYHSRGNVLFSFMMLIGFRIFSFSLSGLRQAIALGLIYIAYICLRDKKYARFVILNILAALFHRSALVFIVAFPLMFVNTTYVVVTLLLLFGLNIVTSGSLVDYLASFFFGGRFDSYIARSVGMEFEGGATFFIYLFFYFLVLAFYRKIKKRDVFLSKEFSILSVGIFFSAIGQTMDNVFRIAYYFIFLLFPVSSQMLLSMFNDKKTYSLICFVASFLLAVQYIVFGTGASTENYEFFWTYPH